MIVTTSDGSFTSCCYCNTWCKGRLYVYHNVLCPFFPSIITTVRQEMAHPNFFVVNLTRWLKLTFSNDESAIRFAFKQPKQCFSLHVICIHFTCQASRCVNYLLFALILMALKWRAALSVPSHPSSRPAASPAQENSTVKQSLKPRRGTFLHRHTKGYPHHPPQLRRPLLSFFFFASFQQFPATLADTLSGAKWSKRGVHIG